MCCVACLLFCVIVRYAGIQRERGGLGACGVALIFSGVPCNVSEYRIGVGLGGEIALASGFVWVIDRAVLLGPKSSFC